MEVVLRSTKIRYGWRRRLIEIKSILAAS